MLHTPARSVQLEHAVAIPAFIAAGGRVEGPIIRVGPSQGLV